MLCYLELIVCFVFGCVAPAQAANPVPPDTARIVSVIGTGAVAHGCPVSPYLLLTAGHVVESSTPFQPSTLLAFRGESSEWAGYLDGTFASDYEDAGMMKPADGFPPFPSWYEFAMAPPRIGEQLWWVGFDWRKGRAFERRVYTGRVTALPAGSIVLNVETPRGSSGSCVLNQAGQIVGEIVWGWPQDGTETRVAVAVGMYPPWFTGFKAGAKK